MAVKTVFFDQQEFEDLCSFQCTEEEICLWFRCSVSTLDKWCKTTYNARFNEIFAQKRKLGLLSLRRKQFQVAIGGNGEKPNVTMLIFLGKNYLGQSDNVGIKSQIQIESVETLNKENITAVIDAARSLVLEQPKTN